jgi:hypothetical protein
VQQHSKSPTPRSARCAPKLAALGNGKAFTVRYVLAEILTAKSKTAACGLPDPAIEFGPFQVE